MSGLLNGLRISFEIVSLFFYISVIWVLVLKRKDRSLKSSFFKLCISIGIADVLCLLSRLVFWSLPVIFHARFPEVIAGTAFATLSSAIRGWGFYFVQIFGIVILSVNRLTALLKPFHYEKYWEGRLKFCVLVQWLWFFPFSLPQMHPSCHSHIRDNTSFTTEFNDPSVFDMFWTADSILEGMTFLPLLLFIHAYMLVESFRFGKKRGKNRSRSEEKTLSIEKRYTIIGTVLCSIYAFMAFTWLFVWLNGDYANDQHALLSQLATEIFTCINPYLLVGVSSTFRRRYLEVMSCGMVKKPAKKKARNRSSSLSRKRVPPSPEFRETRA